MTIDELDEFIFCIQSQGFDFTDCPHPPIMPEWLNFPIVQAIRKAEQSTGHNYNDCITKYMEVNETMPEYYITKKRYNE